MDIEMLEGAPPWPQHPGIKLKIALRLLGIPKADIARHLQISRQSLHDILRGRQALTPGMALRIGKLTGTEAETWLQLQLAYDLAHARRKDRDLLRTIPALAEKW